MSTSKLVINYETECGKEGTVEYGEGITLPTFYGTKDAQCITFVKGILAEREISYNRILEVYTTTTVYSAYEEGEKALADLP